MYELHRHKCCWIYISVKFERCMLIWCQTLIQREDAQAGCFSMTVREKLVAEFSKIDLSVLSRQIKFNCLNDMSPDIIRINLKKVLLSWQSSSLIRGFFHQDQGKYPQVNWKPSLPQTKQNLFFSLSKKWPLNLQSLGCSSFVFYFPSLLRFLSYVIIKKKELINEYQYQYLNFLTRNPHPLDTRNYCTPQLVLSWRKISIN